MDKLSGGKLRGGKLRDRPRWVPTSEDVTEWAQMLAVFVCPFAVGVGVGAWLSSWIN